MSNLHRPVSKKNTNTQLMGKQYFNALTRSIIVLGLVAGSNSLGLSPLLAAPTAPNTTIDNQATGTFTDGDDPGAQPESIVSNVVTVTVAEVAGISITADNTPEPYPNALVNFDFEIKNIGNDPTKFFLSTAPSSVVGGTAGTLQIVAYVDANGVKTTLTTPIDITTAGNTGSIGDGTLGSNITDGSIPAGAAIIVRVPVTVTAAVNTNVSVTLGNTTSSPNASNTSYIANTNDVYTVDNADTVVGETAGAPINGDVTQHRQEASAISTVLVQNPPLKISGTVFEDVNYGGGAGRDLVSSTGVVRPNVRVEIYNASGTIRGQMLTDTNGQYTFDASNVTGGLIQGNTYQIRVVNSFVTSSRPGGCPLAATVDLPPDSCLQVPVQTFRTSGDTDSNNIADADQNRVGGEVPSKKDAPANSSTQTLSALNSVAGQAVESLTTVVLGSAPFTGVDFGFNFDTIVNTNNIGQGSLRQFVTNSNTLLNTGLAQVGQTAGQEVSIFMIPDGTARPGLSSTYTTGLNGTGGNANAAVIALSSQLVITDNNTSIDARTQTTNVSNSNSGTVGTGLTVGTDAVPLSTIPKPEVVLDFSTMPTVSGNVNPTGGGSNAIVIDAQNSTLAGFAYYGYKIQAGLGGLNKGMIWVKPSVLDSGKAILTQLFGGTLANGSQPPFNAFVGAGMQTSGGAEISNSYFAYLADAANFVNTNGSYIKFSNNELAFNGPQTTSTSDTSGIYSDQLETGIGTKNITVSGNLIRDSNKIAATGAQGQGLQISNSTFVTVENNSFINNNIFGINVSASDSLIQKNIITGTKNGPGFTQGSGIIVYYSGGTGVNNRISQNSTFDNVKLGIDHQIDGVTPNDGLKDDAQPNKGMDYPIITSSSISSDILTVKGYVGNVATGSPTFAGATIEFFVGAPNTDDKGRVFSTDPATVSKLHAEGQTYIGGSTPGNLCTTDASSLFSCSFPVVGTIDAKNITATATDAAGNTSEFSVSNIEPRILLVKRITAINGSKNTFNGDNLANYLQDDANPYDDNVIETSLAPSANFPAADTTFWPDTTAKTSSSFLLGGMNGGNIKPKDVIEYTIYFLSNGDSTATNVLFCDRVPSNVTFMPTAFDSTTPPTPKAPGGVTESRGILAQLNGIDASYTNVADGDAARYFPPGNDPKLAYPKVNCGGTNDNGAVVVNLGSLPNATAPNTPGSYGFIRFQGRVK